MDAVVGQRVAAKVELEGLDIPEMGQLGYPEFELKPQRRGKRCRKPPFRYRLPTRSRRGARASALPPGFRRRGALRRRRSGAEHLFREGALPAPCGGCRPFPGGTLIRFLRRF